MELLVFIGGMISQLTSGLWIEKFGFVAPYWFIFGCLLASVFYVIFFVPESRPSTSKDGMIRRLFRLTSVKRVWYVYKFPRNGTRRNLIIFTLSTGLVVLTILGISGVTVLFLLHSPLCFSAEKVGYFSAFRYLINGIGAVLGIKLLGKCFSEINIARIGIISLASGLLVFGFSRKESLVFLCKYLSSYKTFKNNYLIITCKSITLDIRILAVYRRFVAMDLVNPLTPMSDQDRISPYNINTILSRQVMRIKKNINYRIANWSDTKFSNQHNENRLADSKENY